MTHDEMIAGGLWGVGEHRLMRERMAEFLVDGRRLGERPWQSLSGRLEDYELVKSDREILTAAFALGRLGHERVEIRSVDELGHPLDRPDLDAVVDGCSVGIEVADVRALAGHEGLKRLMRIGIAQMLDDDSFREAFGANALCVNLNPLASFSHTPLKDRAEARRLLAELIAFIEAGDHLPAFDGNLRSFPERYTALVARGCEFHCDSLESGPYFDLGDGPRMGLPYEPDCGRLLAVLNKHRRQAAKYRAVPELWIVLYLTDSDERYRRTLDAIASAAPSITPFTRCIVTDAVGGDICVLTPTGGERFPN